MRRNSSLKMQGHSGMTMAPACQCEGDSRSLSQAPGWRSQYLAIPPVALKYVASVINKHRFILLQRDLLSARAVSVKRSDRLPWVSQSLPVCLWAKPRHLHMLALSFIRRRYALKFIPFAPALHTWIVVKEIDIPRPRPVRPHELRITRRPFRLRITCKHALNADAYALHVVYGTPALGV